jgi:hypothetical protein
VERRRRRWRTAPPEKVKRQCTTTLPKPNGSATRDQHFARAIQSRIDIIEDVMPAVEKEAERHWKIACDRFAELDDLAVRRFQLLAALARIERRQLQAEAAQ